MSDTKVKTAAVYPAKVLECPTDVDALAVMNDLTPAIVDANGTLKVTLTGKQVILYPSHSWLVISPEGLEKILVQAAFHSGLNT